MLKNCPACGSANVDFKTKEIDYDEYKSRVECYSCSHYMDWTRTRDSERKAESAAEDEWNEQIYP